MMTGIRELQAHLRNVATQNGQGARQVVELWGRGVEAGAVANAPVDLGKLRQSINYGATDGGMGATVSVNAP